MYIYTQNLSGEKIPNLPQRPSVEETEEQKKSYARSMTLGQTTLGGYFQ